MDKFAIIPEAIYAGMQNALRTQTFSALNGDEVEKVAKEVARNKTATSKLPSDWNSLKEVAKRLSYLSETLDYFGRWKTARAVIPKPADLREQLDAHGAVPIHPSRSELEGRREMVRLYCNSARAHLYRQQDYQQCASQLQHANAYVAALLKPEFKCRGTRAQIATYLSVVYRRTRRLSEAEEYIAEAERCYHEKADDPAMGKAGGFAAYRAVLLIGIGLGRLASIRGELRHASELLSAARCAVRSDRDPVNSAYLALLHGGVRRSQARSVSDELLVLARKDAETALEIFTRVGHSAYEARTLYELASIDLRASRLADAEGWRVKLAKREGDQTANRFAREWAIHALTLHSRIKTNEGKPTEAQEIAAQAIQSAEGEGDGVLKTGPLMALGEAHLGSREWVAAVEVYNRVLDACHSQTSETRGFPRNQQIEAKCQLHLAACYIELSDLAKAFEYLSSARKFVKQAEDGSVRELGRSVEMKYSAASNLAIIAQSAGEESLQERVDWFKQLLVSEAMRKARAELPGAGPVAIKKLVGKRLDCSEKTIQRVLDSIQSHTKQSKTPPQRGEQ